MFTRRNYVILAAITAALFVSVGAIGSDHDVLWILDDVLFFGFIASALLLVVMTIGILVKAVTRRKTTA
jgi:hypothetical protein